MFACESAEITADFICLSKGITGGYLPLSAVLTTDTIYRAFYHDATSKGFLHSHSYTGNPLACSAALATLAIFESDQVLQENQHTSTYMYSQLQQCIASVDINIVHLRKQGMIMAFDVQTQNPNFPRDCYSQALVHGLLIRPIGTTVYFMPPYIISESEIDFMLETALSAVAASM
jgi:adenosylmethionine-8-amino-7-oxononanoate aminotransferase